MQKPPIAPKPKLVQPPGPLLSTSTPRKDGLSLPSPSTQTRVKPALAPKPYLSKLGPALETKPLALQTLRHPPDRETPRAEGHLYPQGDDQRENKKPDWDYIIPVCGHSVDTHKVEKDLNVWQKSNGKTEENTQLFSKSQSRFDNQTISINLNKPLQETFKVERNLNPDRRNGTVRPPVPHGTWSDEEKGDVEPQDEPGRGPEQDVLGPEQTPRPKPPSTGPAKPVPVPRKLRTAGLAPQERVEEEWEDTPGRDGTQRNVKEVKVLLEGKSISSPSAGAPVEKQPATAGKAWAIPEPPPWKKPHLSVPEKTSTPAPQTLPKDVLEEDLGRDSRCHPMQVSLDKAGKAAEEQERDGERLETVYADIIRKLSGSHEPPVAAEEGLVREGCKKPQQAGGPMAWMSTNKSSAESQEKLRGPEKSQSPARGGLEADVSRSFLTPAPVKPCQPSLSKHKSKSFSAADLVRSEGQRSSSFRKLLDLKLKMMPKPKIKADQIPGGAAPSQSVDSELFSYEHKLPCPVIEVEQWEDGDDELYYENVSHYEEVADYMNINVEVSSAARAALSPLTPFGNGALQPLAWQSPAYSDEDIYEEPDPYVPFERNDGQRCPTPPDCER